MARRRDYRRGGFTRGAITGDAKAAKMIQELGEDVLAAAKEALKKGAFMIALDAKSRCPVSDDIYLPNRGLHPGQLMGSITTKAKRSGTQYEIAAEAKDEKGVYYGQFVEFDPRINKPFLYPAMDANRNNVYSMIHQAIVAAVNKKKAGR